MFDPKQLLDQVMGGAMGGGAGPGGLGNIANQARDRLNQASRPQAFGAGAVAGGLLGMLLGGKKVRKLAGGALGYGGAAALGAIAYQAYQTYRQNQGGANPLASIPQATPELLPHAQPAADGGAFELVLIRGMIAAAKADGHVDAAEQQRLFAQVERLGLDSEAKAMVFDALTQPVDLGRIASQVATPEQGAELYLASRLAIDPDHPAERAWLDALAGRLKLPAELRASLDKQVTE